jgi:hypothetical protein
MKKIAAQTIVIVISFGVIMFILGLLIGLNHHSPSVVTSVNTDKDLFWQQVTTECKNVDAVPKYKETTHPDGRVSFDIVCDPVRSV